MKTLIKYCRWVWYVICICYEKTRGLDFHTTTTKYRTQSINEYSITDTRQLDTVFKYLDTNNLVKGEIIDIGCGKGMVLVKASKYKYSKITGIDIVPDLISIASKNISILKLQNRVDVMVADATKFEHYDEYNTFYFYNPFPIEIMKQVITCIMDGLKKNPRQVILIYCNPQCSNTIIETDCFEIIKKFQFKFKNVKTYIYKNIK